MRSTSMVYVSMGPVLNFWNSLLLKVWAIWDNINDRGTCLYCLNFIWAFQHFTLSYFGYFWIFRPQDNLDDMSNMCCYRSKNVAGIWVGHFNILRFFLIFLDIPAARQSGRHEQHLPLWRDSVPDTWTPALPLKRALQRYCRRYSRQYCRWYCRW